ncbi:MAG: NirD/YgiW/YdeI family stress tolerance protein [Alphaproteobacteria bacterium]|nr:NirD/YgiW/YdeI family stress tolerance protein [Alphaproteobacteria bacterium]
MKKTLHVCALALILGLSSNAIAQQQAGGYTGPSAVKTISVAEALKLSDNTAVELVGKIEKSLGDEKYQFSDESGSVIVDIDNEDFRGLTINENDVVKLRGEVDKELLEETVIDVDSVEKVQ